MSMYGTCTDVLLPSFVLPPPPDCSTELGRTKSSVRRTTSSVRHLSRPNSSSSNLSSVPYGTRPPSLSPLRFSLSSALPLAHSPSRAAHEKIYKRKDRRTRRFPRSLLVATRVLLPSFRGCGRWSHGGRFIARWASVGIQARSAPALPAAVCHIMD